MRVFSGFIVVRKIWRLCDKRSQAVRQVFSKLICSHTAVAAYNLNEEAFIHYCVAVLLLLADYLQQDGPRDVVAGLLVDNFQFCVAQNQFFYVGERDIAAFFRVIETSVRVFLDDSGWTHAGIFLPVAAVPEC